ncbi:hypothetical protein [Marasmitruncus massiliensis]|uniref:hypothetical protein n=1 Tax=Marasmitruncus massiliensis TaxID=1944642 RepID=UPI001FA889D6|nr:hypothetical protein [Marasmitruncus massiliensis]
MKRLFAVFLLFSLLCACAQAVHEAPFPESAPDLSVSKEEPSAVSETVSSAVPKEEIPSESSFVSQTSSAANTVSTPLPQATAQYGLSWWEEAFALDSLGNTMKIVESARLYRYSDQVSVTVTSALSPEADPDSISYFPGQKFYNFSYLSALAPEESEDIGEPLSDLSVLEIVLDSDIKYTYKLYERGLEASKLPPGPGMDAVAGEYGENKRLAVDSQAYQTLLSSLRARLKEGRWSSSWLAVMRKSNTERVTVASSDGRYSAEYDRESNWFDLVVSSMRRISVKPETCRRVAADKTLKDAAHVQIDFFNGIQYDIWHDGKTVLVVSSDMDYALKYEADSKYELEELDGMAQERINPPTAKPVIYLYPPKPVDVSVKVHYKGNFTYTYPAYRDGWNVTAYPDGRLVNKADGSEHYYLFWEGDAFVDWKFDEGFVVRGSDTEQFLVEKLSYMGLSPREYNDFIVYWLPELQQNAYNFITFSTEQYEALAPLEISPRPDSILRVHMVYKKLGQPARIKPQVLEPFERRGFTVVEWGGSRA